MTEALRPLLGALLCGTLWLEANVASAQDLTIQNLRAFAKLYGYVRYFHPSSEAVSTDWHRFAVHGVARVKTASSAAELQARLTELFLPLAPTLQVYGPDQQPREVLELFPRPAEGFEGVAWQHYGVGLDSPKDFENIYTSTLHYKRADYRAPGTARLLQKVSAEPCLGQQLRLRAKARHERPSPLDAGQLIVQVVPRAPAAVPEVSVAVVSVAWAPVELLAPVEPDAGSVLVGAAVKGGGGLWVDDVELACLAPDGTASPLELGDPGFEDGTPDAVLGPWIADELEGYSARLDSSQPAAGKWAVRLDASVAMRLQSVPVGEAADKALGLGLRCRVPLALYAQDKTTLPAADPAALQALRADLDKIPLDSARADAEDVRFASVVIGWNVLQHFYPYFDVVQTDWDAALTEALQGASTDKDELDFHRTLRRMMAHLADGHAWVSNAFMRDRSGIPLVLDLVEGQLVVLATERRSTFQVGDVLLEVDGASALDLFHEQEALISGSPQLRRHRALGRVGIGKPDTKAKLRVRRGDQTFEVETLRYRHGLTELTHADIELLEEGVYYVNLSRAGMFEIEAQLAELAKARGVVFDLRGYPRSNDDVISYLIDQPVLSARWNVPIVLYPDQQHLAGYLTDGRWNVVPKQPRFQGKLVFITDGRAMSYAESFMGIIEAYRLAEIVGQPTAGTNGNINRTQLLGGFDIVWTGMKVLKHDGSQHHLVGILPTVPVERTLKGVREGRDELLEKALELLRR